MKKRFLYICLGASALNSYIHAQGYMGLALFSDDYKSTIKKALSKQHIDTNSSHTLEDKKISKNNIAIATVDNMGLTLFSDNTINRQSTNHKVLENNHDTKTTTNKSIDHNTTQQDTPTAKNLPIQSAHENNISSTKAAGVSLKEAILIALNKSYKISAAREKVIQAKRKLDEKKAAYLPKVDLAANAGGSYLSPYQAPEVKYLKSDESLTINENIYAGGKHRYEIKREEANLLVAQEKFKDKVEEETIKIIDSYLSLIYQKKAIEITRDNMLSLKKILDIVTQKESAGASSKGDLNYIKSQVENASSALVKSESKYQNAISFYEYFVGELNEENRPNESTFAFELEDEESILNMMKKHNAKLLIAQAKMDAEKYNLRSKKSKFHPTLDLSITAKDKQSGYASEPQEDRVIGLLSFNYNLYNGGKDKAILLGSKSKIAEHRYKLVDIQEGSLYNTKQLYQNIHSSVDSLTHTKNEVEANKKVIDSYWVAFKYGTQDIQALLLAQRALNRSQQDLIKEEQAYTNGYFKLMQQTGTLLDVIGLADFTNAKKIIQDKSLNYFY